MKNIKKNKQVEPVAFFCKSDEGKVVREFLARVGDKWSILVMVTIARSPARRARFSELQRIVG
jgi:DNA-binding HxlR family transcriptional regulator